MHNLKYKESLPDFLGIGAQRSGTTWLNRNLRKHPEIWMPPRKEIHYFDRALSYPTPSFLASSSIFVKVLGRGKPGRQWREALRDEIKKSLARRQGWREIFWHLRFFFGQYNDKWYASLFKEAQGRITGEITPSYSVLEPEDIKHIKEIMPEVRIVYIIRNPIDRAWSALRFKAWQRRNGRSPDSFSLVDFKKAVGQRGLMLRGNYVRTINNWRNCFPEEQFFIGFFDDIILDPRQLLAEVFEFLRVESSGEYVTLSAFEKINPAPQKEMPPEFRLYLANQYHTQIKTLSEMLGGHANIWLQEVEALLKEASSI